MTTVAIGAVTSAVREVTGVKVNPPDIPAVATVSAQAPKAQPIPTQQPDWKELEESVQQANQKLASRNQQLSLGVDKASGTVVVTVTDKTSGQVVQQIPSEEALRITRSIDQLTGILVDKKE